MVEGKWKIMGWVKVFVWWIFFELKFFGREFVFGKILVGESIYMNVIFVKMDFRINVRMV